jgi:two-component system, sensor histidine kinase PdtaS
VPLSRPLLRLAARTRRLPRSLHWGTAVVFVALAFVARLAMTPIWPAGYPFLFFNAAILAASAIGDRGAGYVAAGTAMVASLYFVPPTGWHLPMTQWLLPIAMFGLLGVSTAAVIDTLHRALQEVEAAHAETRASETCRRMLLEEFRHRSRNDLQSLVGLLLLRARGVTGEARLILKEAAGHALALARVHGRLAQASMVPDSGAWIDTGIFIPGLSADIAKAQSGDGLRPIALHVEAESHRLSTERGVQVGLVLTECLTNSFKYAFPRERAGAVRVRFVREVAMPDGLRPFALRIEDDGVGLPPWEAAGPECPDAAGHLGTAEPAARANGSAPNAGGMGTRLLRSLAAQLRGEFSRCAATAPAVGTVCTLRFPFPEPGEAVVGD